MTEKYIVLNRMYNGNYLKDGNLGHEVTNMYKSDNGNNYIYLQSAGTFHQSRSGKIASVLLVKGIGDNTLEVIGKAVGLTEVYGKENQIDYIKQNDIRYGGVLLNEIFCKKGEYQEIFITFKAEKVLTPLKPLYIKFDKEAEACENIVVLSQCAQAKTSLKQYVSSADHSDDLVLLQELIDSDTLWGEEVKKVTEVKVNNFTHTMFDVCGIKYNELAYSHSLYYFLKNNYDFAKAFVSDFLGLAHNLTPNYKVYREKGNIDLYIEDGDMIIIIENKIKSGINGTSKRSEKVSQLEKYLKNTEAELKAREKGKKKNERITYTIKAYILSPDYNDIDISQYRRSDEYEKIYYSSLHKFMKEYQAYGKDADFTMFTDALERHTVKYDNELYDEMTRLFAERIKANPTK